MAVTEPPAVGAPSDDATAQTAATGLKRRRVGTFSNPTYVTAPPGDRTRLFVVEQGGTIRVVQRGHKRARPYLDIRDRVQSGGEQGLLSMAFAPKYRKNHRFYVYYTQHGGDIRVVEFKGRRNRARKASARTILAQDHSTYGNHNGGQLQFGPDGRLYIGLGDGGGGGDPFGSGQNLGSKLGKILRINPRGKPRIPRSNPFRGRSGANPAVYSYGLRNPWRFSFDRTTGDLYIGDVGGGRWEEIDRRPRGSASPSNFGWSAYEGREHVRDTPLGPDPPTPPIAFYPHRKGACTAVVGGYVYRGPSLPGARGRYFYGDLCSGLVWSVRIAGGKATAWRREPVVVPQLLASFGEDAAGELYAVSLAGGTVYRIAGG